MKKDHDHYGKAPADLGPLFHDVPVRAHRRTIKGAAPADGETRKAQVMEAFDADTDIQRAKAYVRVKLAELYRERHNAFRMGAQSSEAFVTADDADRLLREWPEFPKALLERESQAWRGAIFRCSDWCKTGRYITAKRQHMKATDLPCWALRAA